MVMNLPNLRIWNGYTLWWTITRQSMMPHYESSTYIPITSSSPSHPSHASPCPSESTCRANYRIPMVPNCCPLFMALSNRDDYLPNFPSLSTDWQLCPINPRECASGAQNPITRTTKLGRWTPTDKSFTSKRTLGRQQQTQADPVTDTAISWQRSMALTSPFDWHRHHPRHIHPNWYNGAFNRLLPCPPPMTTDNWVTDWLISGYGSQWEAQ